MTAVKAIVDDESLCLMPEECTKGVSVDPGSVMFASRQGIEDSLSHYGTDETMPEPTTKTEVVANDQVFCQDALQDGASPMRRKSSKFVRIEEEKFDGYKWQTQVQVLKYELMPLF